MIIPPKTSRYNRMTSQYPMCSMIVSSGTFKPHLPPKTTSLHAGFGASVGLPKTVKLAKDASSKAFVAYMKSYPDERVAKMLGKTNLATFKESWGDLRGVVATSDIPKGAPIVEVRGREERRTEGWAEGWSEATARGIILTVPLPLFAASRSSPGTLRVMHRLGNVRYNRIRGRFAFDGSP